MLGIYKYILLLLSIREVSKLVKKIIADYGDQLQEDESLKDLFGLFDIIADTCWPRALGLVWCLDEIYR